MAKIKHNNFLDTVHEVFTEAKKEGILHLYADGESFSGRKIGIDKRLLFHFGTTGYLGLEQDVRLKKAAIEAIERYGTQFPLSKSYISNPLYEELEDKISEMYGNPIIITKNSTLGHIGVIPTAVKDDDAIILDHQVHWSVQNAAKILKTRSVPTDMVRHNNLDMLEDKIKYYRNKRKKIWYMADGIYSMYGDYAPVKELMSLCKKYPQLHLYFDDVHGMSWTGKNGTGYVLSQLMELPENVLLFGTLSKTFGASGSFLVCSNPTLHDEIKTFGGPLTFSAQLDPASIGAAIASAKIHLSPEIYALQKELKDRISYFNSLLSHTELPVIDNNPSPVFYIGTGTPKTGYNFVNRLMKEGFYVNLGLFPAVPAKNTGVRITISRHNQKSEIKELVDAMEYHLPRALEDTNTNIGRVRRAFNLPTKEMDISNKNEGLETTWENTISDIDEKFWNRFMGAGGVFDWEGLHFLEKSFSNNQRTEDNWIFKYLIISDKNGIPVLISFFTISLWKDDMLAKPNVSKLFEKERLTKPYSHTSKVLSMGCLFTEGDHLYVNQSHPKSKLAVELMLKHLEELEAKHQAKMIVLRDFSTDTTLQKELQHHGYIRLKMPEISILKLNNITKIEELISMLSSRNRRHVRNEIYKTASEIMVTVTESLAKQELDIAYKLYKNVQKNNLGLNTFPFPFKVFEEMNRQDNWEFIAIYPKHNRKQLMGIMFCYKNESEVYVPSFVGLDYEYNKKYHVYRQLLYHTIKRAIELSMKSVSFGMTASFEKRKLGAKVYQRFAYLQTSDNFILERMGVLETN